VVAAEAAAISAAECRAAVSLGAGWAQAVFLVPE